MIGIASLVAFTTSIIMFYVVQSFGIAPKTNLIIFSVVFIVLFLMWRRVFYNFFSIYFKKGVAFLTQQNKDDQSVDEIIKYIEAYPQSGFEVLGRYSSIGALRDAYGTKKIDTLIVSKNSLKEARDLVLIYSTVENILDLTHAYENILSKIPVDSIDETWFLYNVQKKNTVFYSSIKSFVSGVVALIILFVTFPFLLVVALCIKLYDNGPILYTQARVREGGKTFKLYKFRSMITDSEKNGAVWAIKNDHRITPVGKIIRKLHLDEIPQMINILKGDISLVGPRPERPEFVVELENTIPHYSLRHIIKPGFTGWAQIKYRYANTAEDSKEKFQYDLYYIKNRNIFLDFGIILRTVQIIFTH